VNRHPNAADLARAFHEGVRQSPRTKDRPAFHTLSADAQQRYIDVADYALDVLLGDGLSLVRRDSRDGDVYPAGL